MKTTVTQDAPVASPRNMEEAFDSGFLPRDETYRKTGKFSEEKEPITTPDPDIDTEESASSGEQDGETAAASQAAQPQEQETKQPEQRRKDGENRWAKLSRENRELREREARRDREMAELRARIDGTTPRENKQESQPAATKGRTEPKIDDVDPKTGKAKYADWNEWFNDLRKWDREQAVSEFSEHNAKAEKERQQRAQQEAVTKGWNDRVAAADKEYPDFREVALNPDLPIKQGSVADVFILARPSGAKVLYHLGKNPEVLDAINAMNPIDAAFALSEIELQVSKKSSAPVRTVTQAPKPPSQVSGKGTVAKDAVDDAVKQQDLQTYMREANARDSRLQSVRNSRR